MFKPTIERIVKIIPGWDCLYAPCTQERKCTLGDSCGIHNDEAIYAAKCEWLDGRKIALTLQVGTHRYPSTIPKSHFGNSSYLLERPRAYDLSLHVQQPKNPGGQSCLVVPNCVVEQTSALEADIFWKKHCDAVGAEAIDKFIDAPSEAFWIAFEGELLKRLSDPYSFTQENEPTYLRTARMAKEFAEREQITAQARMTSCEKEFAQSCDRYRKER